MSILSLFEIIFWIWRAFTHGLGKAADSCWKREPKTTTKNEVGVKREVIVVMPKQDDGNDANAADLDTEESKMSC